MKEKTINKDALKRLLWLLGTHETRRIVNLAKKKFGEENVTSNIFDADYKEAFFEGLVTQECTKQVFLKIRNCFSEKFVEELGLGFGTYEELPINLMALFKYPIDIVEYIYKKIRDNNSEYARQIIWFVAKDYCWAMLKNEFMHPIPDVEKHISEKPNNVYIGEQLVYIRFPEIEVVSNENSQQKVLLKNYFVRFNTTCGAIASTHFTRNVHQIGLSGVKTTYTYEQFAANYVHSHRPRLERPEQALEFRCQCVGENSPIVDFVNKLDRCILPFKYRTLSWTDSDVMPVLQDSYIRLWLNHVKTYLGVESSLGGPWIYMSAINTNNSSRAVKDNDVIKPAVRSFSELEDYTRRTFNVPLSMIIEENNKRKWIKFYSKGGIIKFANTYSDLRINLTNLYFIVLEKILKAKYEGNRIFNLEETMKQKKLESCYRVMMSKSQDEFVFPTRGVNEDKINMFNRATQNDYILMNGTKYQFEVKCEDNSQEIFVLNSNVFSYYHLGMLMYVNNF